METVKITYPIPNTGLFTESLLQREVAELRRKIERLEKEVALQREQIDHILRFK